MLTIGFWNINRRSLSEVAVRVMTNHSIDIMVFAELPEQPETFLDQMTSSLSTKYSVHSHPDNKLQILSRFSSTDFNAEYDDALTRLSIRHFIGSEPQSINIAAVHLLSRLHADREDLSELADAPAKDILRFEAARGHSRTVVIGDFNMNPFETAMVSATKFNAMMTRPLCAPDSRTVQGNTFMKFYNPMWSHFGDRNFGPPGSYYYKPGGATSTYWNMYDQVLVRPSLLTHFRDVVIVDHDGERSLVKDDGTPDDEIASDHLPLVLKLDLRLGVANAG